MELNVSENILPEQQQTNIFVVIVYFLFFLKKASLEK